MPKIFALKLSWPPNDLYFQDLLSITTNAGRDKALGYRNREDAYRSLSGEFLAKCAISFTTELNPENLLFSYSAFGKPYLEGINDLHFNISHSGDWVVCAIDNAPIGIDIEYISGVDPIFYRDYLSEEENEWLMLAAEPARQELFYELWTLKESYIKQQGKGLSIPPGSFSINMLPNQPPFLTIKNEKVDGIFFKQYDIHADYKMAVCAQSDSFDEILVFDLEELYTTKSKY
jgi:4'-phosphopantetheinyl transferase